MALLLLTSFIPNLNQLIPSLIAHTGNWIDVILFGVIFIETGVVIFPFLPGDSLLFLCGSLAALGNGAINYGLLVGLLTGAAVLGDALNFEIGEHFGAYLTTSQKFKRVMKPAYLQRSQTFFKKYGHIAIFLGRLIPVVRTFVPFTAGIGKMHYRDFAIYNILGGFSWVTLVTGAGYLFGNVPFIKAHFELIMLAIIGISLFPMIVMAIRKRGMTADEH